MSVKLLYERVNARRKPHMQFLNNPVIQYMDLTRREHQHDLRDLPQGRYIVCAEATTGKKVFESNCCEVNVQRADPEGEEDVLDSKEIILLSYLLGLQIGVKILTFLSFLLIIFSLIFSIVYKICKRRVSTLTEKRM